uniref:hypothetical protein n=1 Tax=Enterocloster clostridioformis TaxID=1531 RepID=UPI0025A578FF
QKNFKIDFPYNIHNHGKMAQSQENQGVTPFCTFLSVKDGIVNNHFILNQIQDSVKKISPVPDRPV